MMAERIKLTRPSLKHHRDALARFTRYLPTLKLKQRLLQTSVTAAEQERSAAAKELEQWDRRIRAQDPLQRLPAGVDLSFMATPTEVTISESNIAGVVVPTFQEAVFPPPQYSLVSTASFADALIRTMVAREQAHIQLQTISLKLTRLHREFIRVNQRLNLFEKVMIPKTEHAIHVIRIYLGDEQTAAVGRAKLAKAKQVRRRIGGPHHQREDGADR